MKLYEVYDIERSTVDPTWRKISDRWRIFPKEIISDCDRKYYVLKHFSKIFKLINEKYIKVINIEDEFSEIVLRDGERYLIDTDELGLYLDWFKLASKERVENKLPEEKAGTVTYDATWKPKKVR